MLCSYRALAAALSSYNALVKLFYKKNYLTAAPFNANSPVFSVYYCNFSYSYSYKAGILVVADANFRL